MAVSHNMKTLKQAARGVYWTVYTAVRDVVYDTVHWAVHRAAYDGVHGAVHMAVDERISGFDD